MSVLRHKPILSIAIGISIGNLQTLMGDVQLSTGADSYQSARVDLPPDTGRADMHKSRVDNVSPNTGQSYINHVIVMHL